MAEKARIQVRIGAHEFNAEGPADLVKSQYEQFLKALPAGSTGAARIIRHVPDRISKSWYEPASLGKPMRLALRQPLGTTSNTIILALLYGFLVLYDQDEVLASDLLPLLAANGFKGDGEARVDRLIDANTGFIVRSGAKRGSRYSLTQAGVDHIESLLRQW